MRYLNQRCLDDISAQAFRSQQPYPWASIQDTLTAEGYKRLCESLPELALFERQVGKKRAYGQASHDRYWLHYRRDLALSAPWREFIAELHGDAYRSFLRRMLGTANFILTMEWHYSWRGCSVSPHCDAARKRATHLFYFNTEADWNRQWGGETLILESVRPLKTHSGPSFDEMRIAAAPEPAGNRSLLFRRMPHSWHGVLPLQCPEDALRKVFHITINAPSWQVWWRRVRGKDPDGFPLGAPSSILQ
jgi:2-oxoglutarate-Fe(II)-dependent oxygenase superfamily protein